MDNFFKSIGALIPFFSAYPYWVKILATVWFIFTAIFLATLIFSRSSATSDVIVQNGVLENIDIGKIEVYYPNPFSSPPNLNISTSVGKKKYYVDFIIIDQRSDGFKLDIGALTRGDKLSWEAKGIIKKEK